MQDATQHTQLFDLLHTAAAVTKGWRLLGPPPVGRAHSSTPHNTILLYRDSDSPHTVAKKAERSRTHRIPTPGQIHSALYQQETPRCPCQPACNHATQSPYANASHQLHCQGTQGLH
jgi:hypothetical protein